MNETFQNNSRGNNNNKCQQKRMQNPVEHLRWSLLRK